MNKHILTLATALTLLCIGGGCDYNDDNFEGLQHGTVATDVKRFDYTLTDDDYKTIANNAANKTLASANGVSSELASVTTNKYFTKKVSGTDYIPNFLAATYPTADNGSAIKVTYNFYNVAGFEEDFETVTNDGPAPNSWANVVTNDNETSAKWVGKVYSNNGYVQCSAFKKGSTEVYLVSPSIEVDNDMTFSFKACYGNYKAEGGTLSVLISLDLKGEVTKESIAAATWKDITDQVNITIPTGTYGTLEEVCSYKMDDFAGKEVRIAFRYDGDGTDGANKTTTVQIDDVKISDDSGEVISGTVEMTEQFVRSKGHWSFDPSVVWVLPAGRNQATSAEFFQACVNWVFENIDTPLGSTGIKSGAYYVTSYGNNEYYTGASAYQGNLDWRVSAARGQYAAAFEGKTDVEVTEMLQARTAEVFAAVLPQFYPELEPLEGVDVTVTIQCTVYTGSSTVYNFIFKVVEKGLFEFVSFAPVD